MENNQHPIVFGGYTKTQLATIIALIFHAIGIVGILFINQALFAEASALNLLLMFGLLLYTQKKINTPFIFFFFFVFISGFFIEMIGTKTGWLFGNYAYGTTLGLSIQRVPLIIGINWFIIIYCCGISTETLLHSLMNKLSPTAESPKPLLKKISVIIDGATIALLFDWIMEPVAIKLGYWQWMTNGSVPLYNYFCWFVISMIFLLAFHQFKFIKQNIFAVHLLLIQTIFFLLLRTFL